MTRLDHTDPRTVLDARTVIVVDEASTIGNRQLDRLYRHAQATGATVRTIGTPSTSEAPEPGAATVSSPTTSPRSPASPLTEIPRNPTVGRTSHEQPSTAARSTRWSYFFRGK